MSPSSIGLNLGPIGPGLGLEAEDPLVGEQPALCLSRLGQDLAAGKQNVLSKLSGFNVSILELFSTLNELQASTGVDSALDLWLLFEDNCGELVLVISCRIVPPFTQRKL